MHTAIDILGTLWLALIARNLIVMAMRPRDTLYQMGYAYGEWSAMGERLLRR